MAVYGIRKPDQNQSNAGLFAMFNGAQDPAQQQQQAAQTPAPQPTATVPPTDTSAPTPITMPQLEKVQPFKADAPMSLEQWQQSPEGQNSVRPEYKRDGFWSTLGRALSFGAMEFGGAANGHPGQGIAQSTDYVNEQQRRREFNAARPGMLQSAYKDRYLAPFQQNQQIQLGQWNANREAAQQNNAASMGQFNVEQGMRGRQNEILRSGLQLKGKMQDDAIVAQILRDANQQGTPLNEDYVRRVVAAQPIVGPRFQVLKGEGGRPTGIADTYGKSYAPNEKGQLVGPDGNVLADQEAATLWSQAMQGHSQERTEKRQDQEHQAALIAANQAALLHAQGGNLSDANDPHTSTLIDLVGTGKISVQDALPARVPAPARAAFLAEVAQRYPQFNSGDHGVIVAGNKFMTSGNGGQTLTAFNTAIEHADMLRQAAQALQNGNTPVFNEFAQRWAKATGSSAPTNFDQIRDALAGEATKIFNNGHITEGELHAYRDHINKAQSPEQLLGGVDTTLGLMKSKRHALQQQYEASQQARPNFGGGGDANQGGGQKAFSKSRWKAAHPNGDLNAAIAEAERQQFKVVD